MIELSCLWMQAKITGNEILKEIFQEMQPQIVGINPDSIMDALFSVKVICVDDCCKLCDSFPVPKDHCRQLLFLLHRSPHPQAFIHLRLALLDEYPWIVDQIDKKLTSLTSQLQEFHLGNSTDGKSLVVRQRQHSINSERLCQWKPTIFDHPQIWSP